MNHTVNPQGFVTQWLVSGPSCTPYAPPQTLEKTWTDQLGYEKRLREIFYPETTAVPVANPCLAETGPAGQPWRYLSSAAGWFVDVSTFYSLLTKVRLDATTVLHSAEAKTVRAVLWTYAAVDVWVNGCQVLHAKPPVYKPIAHYTIDLPLQAGANTVYILMHNLGVRDTRSLFGLQLQEVEGISVSVPHAEQAQPLAALDTWLQGLRCANGSLFSNGEAPVGALFVPENGEMQPLTGAGPWPIAKTVGGFTVRTAALCQTLERRFECLENLHPLRLEQPENHYQKFLQRMAERKWEPRGNGVNFCAFNVIARRALGCPREDDDALLLQDLDFIESRGDCADFLVIALVRLVHNYPVSDAVKTRMREVLLNFRYWMDENGDDGMCFWSENHALMFYGAQMVVGGMYPDDIFVRSGRTGAQQKAMGEARCREWLDDVEREGVEEFNSASYMPVTLAALLNLIDFAPADIAVRARAVLDSLLRQLCLHVFSESVISPQGRVYRDAIYPSRQTVQTLLHLIDPTLPYATKESIWCVCFDTTAYTFPEDLPALMRSEAHTSYLSGNARIALEKTGDYLLTSVRSPRAADDAPHWQNLCFVDGANRDTNAYVKSLNERFHGTSVFEPGVYGYQQHLWYAALSNEAVVFVTHPGSAADFDGMRPGYWYGNGVFPAVAQDQTVLGAVYEIPAEHPICFTHTFWPTAKFEQSVQDGHWLFGCVGKGYVALWCSGEQTPHDDALHQCEYRCYARKAAYCCVCGNQAQHGSFAAFMASCKGLAPTYDAQKGTLQAAQLTVTYTPHQNRTQFI